MKLAVIGAGAAGVFAAITAKQEHPEQEVVIYEQTRKPLSKVKISGGGRCNVTNGSSSIKELAQAYPRGGKQMKKLLPEFHTGHIMEWFEKRGVGLVTEADGRVFPDTHRSSTIIDCLLEELDKLGVRLELGMELEQLKPREEGFELHFRKGEPVRADKLIVASGGSPKRKGLEWLEEFGHSIVDPLPSLFTFNMPGEGVTELAGVSVEKVRASVQGSKLKSEGPLLVTHWGMSGPAILKLSAFGARILNGMDYRFKLQLNWSGDGNEGEVLEDLERTLQEHPRKQIQNLPALDLPQRLWAYLIERAGISRDKPWGEMGRKSLHRLADRLTRDVYEVQGKSTFKEEFVTCGGVSWESVDPRTMESKACPGLYFAGEILDIDGITGGYNFQAAWTTGFVAGHLRERSG